MSLKVDFVHWKTSIFVTIWPFSTYVNDQKMVQSLIPHYPEPFLSPWGPWTCHLYHLRQKSSNNYLQHFLSKSKFWNRNFGQTNKNGAPDFGYFHDFYQNFLKKVSGAGGEWGHWIFFVGSENHILADFYVKNFANSKISFPVNYLWPIP